jgi:hypothetical protein
MLRSPSSPNPRRTETFRTHEITVQCLLGGIVTSLTDVFFICRRVTAALRSAKPEHLVRPRLRAPSRVCSPPITITILTTASVSSFALDTTTPSVALSLEDIYYTDAYDGLVLPWHLNIPMRKHACNDRVVPHNSNRSWELVTG